MGLGTRPAETGTCTGLALACFALSPNIYYFPFRLYNWSKQEIHFSFLASLCLNFFLECYCNSTACGTNRSEWDPVRSARARRTHKWCHEWREIIARESVKLPLRSRVSKQSTNSINLNFKHTDPAVNFGFNCGAIDILYGRNLWKLNRRSVKWFEAA